MESRERPARAPGTRLGSLEGKFVNLRAQGFLNLMLSMITECVVCFWNLLELAIRLITETILAIWLRCLE